MSGAAKHSSASIRLWGGLEGAAPRETGERDGASREMAREDQGGTLKGERRPAHVHALLYCTGARLVTQSCPTL